MSLTKFLNDIDKISTLPAHKGRFMDHEEIVGIKETITMMACVIRHAKEKADWVLEFSKCPGAREAARDWTTKWDKEFSDETV